MKKCKHIFKGHANGVTCMRCGLEMTAEEYAEFLSSKEPDGDKKGKQDEPEQTKQEEQEQPEGEEAGKSQEVSTDE